jgi:TPR repeat protein
VRIVRRGGRAFHLRELPRGALLRRRLPARALEVGAQGGVRGHEGRARAAGALGGAGGAHAAGAPTTCSGCALPKDKLYPCAACQCESYCSHACQHAHWPAHKVKCKGLAAASFEIIAERARAGDVGMQFNLGQCYQLGTGVAVDFAASFVWYKRAADAGHVKAQSCVG